MKSYPLIPELLCSEYIKSLKFYTDVLGFKIAYERPEDSFAMLERQGVRIMLEQYISDGRWNMAEMVYPFGRGINFQIVTSEINSLYSHVENSNVPIFMPLEEKWYRAADRYVGNKQFLIQDPDGYLLRFFEDMGERADRPQ